MKGKFFQKNINRQILKIAFLPCLVSLFFLPGSYQKGVASILAETETAIITLSSSPIPPITPTVSPTIQPTVNTSVEDINAIASRTIASYETTIDLMKWVIGGVVAILIGGSTLLIYFVKIVNEAKINSTDAKKSSDAANEAIKNAIKTIDNMNEIIKQVRDLEEQYQILIQKTASLDEAIRKYENGEISRKEYIEKQQKESYLKWRLNKNPDGYTELQAHQCYEKLEPSIEQLINRDILLIKANSKISKEDKDTLEKLSSLVKDS